MFFLPLTTDLLKLGARIKFIIIVEYRWIFPLTSSLMRNKTVNLRELSITRRSTLCAMRKDNQLFTRRFVLCKN